MKNFRKKQMRLAVLMAISDKAKRNGEIIKEAESKLILDDEYNRLMQNGKQSVGSKELQFILYYIKKGNLAQMPSRGVYLESVATIKERNAVAVEVLQAIDNPETKAEGVILNNETILSVRNIVKAIPVESVADGEKIEVLEKTEDSNISDTDATQVENDEGLGSKNSTNKSKKEKSVER